MQLYELFKDQLSRDGLNELFFNIEMPLASILADMELAGIKLDVDYVRQLANVDALMDDPQALAAYLGERGKGKL